MTGLFRRPVVQPLAGALDGLAVPGTCGVVALLLAAVLALVVTPHWLQQAQQAADAARRERIAAADALRARVTVAPPRLAAMAWPEAAERDARVARLLALAREQGVVLRSLSQTPAAAAERGAVAAGGPDWQTLVLPVRATYAALRGFVSAALAADPALALDAVQWRREGSERGELEAELTWALASARDSAPGAAPSRKLP